MGFSTPVLSGSVPNPVTLPLQGVLNWTQSSETSSITAALLIHFDGTNGSTTFTDTSGNGNIVTAHGTAQVDTSAPEFGTGAGKMVANTDLITVPCPAGGGLDLSTGDFTVEFWFKPANYLATYEIFEIGMGTAFVSGGFFIYSLGTKAIYCEGVASPSGTFSGSIADTGWGNGVWMHCAVCRQGSYYSICLNGNTICMNPSSPYPTMKWGTGPNNDVRIGKGNWDNSVAGNEYDELRITTGTALYPPVLTTPYKGTYVVPSSPFSNGGSVIYAPGYDVYRNGVSIATVGNVLTYTDNVPAYGTYTYNVAAYDPGVPGDISPESNPVSLTYSASVVGFPNCIFDEQIYGAYFGGQLNLVEFTYMPGRTPFEEGATNLIINRYLQEPTDTRQRGVDFTQFAVPGEILTGVTVTGISAQGVPQAQTNPLVTPLVITNVVIDPVTQLKFAYSVSGGQNGIEYTVQFTTTTSIQTETLEEIFSINIRVEDMFP